jgi:hypothetical protein
MPRHFKNRIVPAANTKIPERQRLAMQRQDETNKSQIQTAVTGGRYEKN